MLAALATTVVLAATPAAPPPGHHAPTARAAGAGCWYAQNVYNFHLPGGANVASLTKTVTWCDDGVIIDSASWGHRTWGTLGFCITNTYNAHSWLNWPFTQHGLETGSEGVLSPGGCVSFSPTERAALIINPNGTYIPGDY